MKERITVTIEQHLLKQIDSSVDGVQIKNRSHAIELFVERSLKNVLPSKAVILAGGDTRKLLKPVHGKSVLTHNILLLAKHGISTIFLAVNKHDSRVKEYLGDGSKFDVQFTYFEEDDLLGTAGCLHAMKEHLAKQPTVVTMIPLEAGEPQGTVHPIVLNGYRLNIRKGTMVQVPQQIAEIIAESFNLTYAAGRDKLIDRDSNVSNALN